MNNQNNPQKNLIRTLDTHSVSFFISGLIVGMLLGYFFGGNAKEGLQNIPDAVDINIPIATSSPRYTVSVNNQSAGSSVIISSVTVPEISWVAIRENNNDVMGRILGAQKVFPGTARDVIVELLRPTASQVMYATVIYKDNGDGEFDFKVDELVSQDEAPVLSRFLVQ